MNWRYKVGVASLAAGLLLNYVKLPVEWNAQYLVEFFNGLLLSAGVILLIAALVNMRKGQDQD